MKHQATREFFAYWNGKRGDARAPDRSEIEPSALRERLGDIFVLSCDAAAGYPFRVAGTRVCALFGRDLKDRSFSSLFAAGARQEIEDIVAAVTEDTLPAIVGVGTTSPRGTTTHLELLLLPFSNRAYAPISLTGLLAPFEETSDTLGELTLTSWRYIHPPVQRLVPRALRKLKMARGFMVYEGLR
jgi:hypothetical protein